MLLKVSDNYYINKSEIREVRIQERYVSFKDKNNRPFGVMIFDSEEEAKKYCDELSLEIHADAIASVAKQVENLG